MAEIQIRDLELEDWSAYKAIRLRSLLDSPDAFGSTHDGEARFTPTQWQSRLDPAAGEVGKPLVAVLDAKFVGLAWGRISQESSQTAHVYQMWVDPDVRGQGVGARLLHTLVSWSQAQGVEQVELGVNADNLAARSIYAAAGFQVFGEREPLREGSAQFVQNMRLRLAAPGSLVS